MLVRPIEHHDSESIRAIYNAEVQSSTATLDLRERTNDDQHAWMQEHCGVYAAIVAVDDELPTRPVIGFASLSPYRPRPGYLSTAENSVYVREDYRGRGIGQLLLNEICAEAVTHGFTSVVAFVGSANVASIKSHEGCGFVRAGELKKVARKFSKWIDVIILQNVLGDQPT